MGSPFFRQILFLPQILFTDAAGSKGFGAIWKCAAWPESWINKHATRNVVLLELFPILVALGFLGADFADRRILVETDNRGVLYAVNCLSSGSLLVIKVLKILPGF